MTQLRAREALSWMALSLSFAVTGALLGAWAAQQVTLEAWMRSAWCGVALHEEGQFLLLGHCVRCLPSMAAYALAWSALAGAVQRANSARRWQRTAPGYVWRHRQNDGGAS